MRQVLCRKTLPSPWKQRPKSKSKRQASSRDSKQTYYIYAALCCERRHQHHASERRHQYHNRPARHRGGGLEEDKADGAASGAPIAAIAGGSIAAALTAALYIWLRKRTTSTATANKGGRRKARGPRRHQHITLGAWQHRRAAVACHDGGRRRLRPELAPVASE